MYISFINLVINHYKLNPHAVYMVKIGVLPNFKSYDELYIYHIHEKITQVIQYFDKLPILHKTSIIFEFLQKYYEDGYDDFHNFIKNNHAFHFWLEYDFFPALNKSIYEQTLTFNDRGYNYHSDNRITYSQQPLPHNIIVNYK